MKTVYSRDCGWPRRPWPNAGLKKLKNAKKISFFGKKKNDNNKNIFFAYIFYLCQNIGGNKFSRTGVSPKWVGQKQKTEKKEKKKILQGLRVAWAAVTERRP